MSTAPGGRLPRARQFCVVGVRRNAPSSRLVSALRAWRAKNHETERRHQYRRPAPDGEAAAAQGRLRLHRGRARGRARARPQHRGVPQAHLLPRYLVDVSKRDQSQTIFGHKFSSPFGISPTGSAGLFRRGADMMLAEAAREANIPYIMSGASNDTIEAPARVAPNNAWYQLYAAKDGKISDDLIRRTADAGLDGAGVDRRRAGAFEARAQHPQRLRQYPRQLAAGGAEPQAGAARRGDDASRLGRRIHHATAARRRSATGCPMLPPGATPEDTVKFNRAQVPAHAQTWKELEHYRKLFPRNLVVKGIMSPADAMRCAEIGCDGIIVSNHGARQLDQAPASLDVLPAIKAAVGDRMTVMLDSGVRRGADILIALCLGARVLLLRPPDALRRGRRRARRRQEGDRHLPRRDRPGHGPDRLPEPRPARPRFPVARTTGSATARPRRHSERSASNLRVSQRSEIAVAACAAVTTKVTPSPGASRL